jgi:hypothetical protein
MQRSPCHECGIHLAGEDKNGPQCLNCDKRTAYVVALEGRNGPVPMEMTDMAGRWSEKEDQFLRDYPHMHIKAQAEHLGRSIQSVSVRRSTLKLTHQPKDMRRPAESEGAAGSGVHDNIINLEDHPDVLDQLRKRAADELRTVHNQALWFIKCALQGSAPDHGRAPDRSP